MGPPSQVGENPSEQHHGQFLTTGETHGLEIGEPG